MSTPSIAERVAAGVQWLDANVPGWLERIDLEWLSLRNSCSCILGQTFGDYWAAPLLDKRWADDPEKFAARAEWLGFAVADHADDADGEWGALEAEWRRVIQERRIQAEATS